MEVLSGLAEGGEALDMPRLDSLIRRNILRIQNQAGLPLMITPTCTVLTFDL